MNIEVFPGLTGASYALKGFSAQAKLSMQPLHGFGFADWRFGKAGHNECHMLAIDLGKWSNVQFAVCSHRSSLCKLNNIYR